MGVGACLVTGGTGFLGRHLLSRLCREGRTVYALVRPQSKARLEADATLAALSGLQWIEGDISTPEICAQADRERIARDVTDVIHAAALYDLQADHDALYWANVVGTHQLVHFAHHLPRLEAFHYVSTMAVSGDHTGTFTEQMFDEGQRFPDSYAATKFAAESCVREWSTAIPRFIYRLGILVGETGSGAISKVDGPYYLMRALHTRPALRAWLKRLPVVPLPFNERTRLYLVPVDSAASAIVTAMDRARTLEPRPLRTYHVMGELGGTPIRTVLREILNQAGVQARILAVPRNQALPWLTGQLGVPASTLHYMYSACAFEMRGLAADFPELRFPQFQSYFPALHRYAAETLFSGGRS